MTKIEFMTVHETALKQNVNNQLKRIEETKCEIKNIKFQYKEAGMVAVMIIYER